MGEFEQQDRPAKKCEPEGTMPHRYPALLTPLGNETLVYLPHSQKAICLNEVAGAVYLRCDGETSVDVAAEEIGSREVVWQALESFAVHGLIPSDTPRAAGLGRRQLLKLLTSAACLPVVSSVLAPTPARAMSAACIIENSPTTSCDLSGIPMGTVPNDCTSCCGGTLCASACPDCSQCFCLQRRFCVGFDCTTGSCATDTLVTARNCYDDSTVMFGCNFAGICQRNCDDARAAAAVAGVSFYSCCESCT
ncbi:MAG: hypothetical protein AB7S38_00145 [Vulcanimicrobiota bacterium]